MRKTLTLLLCFTSILVSATDYYVSSTGNDSSNGLSSSTPWQTIAKVNTEFSGLNPGDRILFKRGDTFTGTLSVSKAGSASVNIFIDAYGTGSEPIISGFSTVTGWVSEGGGIYSKAVSCESNPNMVLVDGKSSAKGRWPNTGWMTFESHAGSTSISDSELSASPDWTGGEIVVRTYASLVDRTLISDHTGQTLTFSALTQNPVDGSGYFIMNHRSTLDLFGEWCYANGSLYMYFGTQNPQDHSVKISIRDNIVEIYSRNYITIGNIRFEGGNRNAIHLDESDYVTLRNCIIENNGQNGVLGEFNCDYMVVESSDIKNNNNSGILLKGNTAVHNTIRNNDIFYSGSLLGMGGNGFLAYCGVISMGHYSLLTSNRIENSGYDGILFGGQNSEVSYNFINNSNLSKDDGAGIYTWRDTNPGKVIKYNTILNTKARPDGWRYYELVRSHGIYLDGSSNILVSHNTSAQNDGCGIFINATQSVTAEYNTCYDNLWGIRILSETGGLARNHNINNNILFAKKITDPNSVYMQAAFGVVTKLTETDIPLFGSSDYNYFARPVNNDNYIEVWKNAWGWAPGDREAYNLSEWQSKYGKDSHSGPSPVTVSDPSKIRFEYNATNANKLVSLDGSYIDVKGTKYSGTITLSPYSSAVIMVDPNPSAPPAVPAFAGSAVENGAPAVVEMTYNLTLASIVPPASAFSVQVNSAARAVSSVTVSGTKVFLTLASPVAYGNTVTVAYTKPSSNPLQTAAGGQAASLSAQTVTNRVSAPPAAPPTPVYMSAAIENATPARLEMTYNLTLANIVPAASAFSVQVNSAVRSISSVSVSGTKVVLALASPVAYGNTITVAYTKPSSSPLQTAEGGQAASLSAQTVTNRVNAPPVPPAPVFISAAIENATPARLEMTYNLTLADIVPTASAFSVMVNTVARSVSSVSVSGTRVILTLASPVVYGNTVTVAYTKPSVNPLQTPEGGQAASIGAVSVANRLSAPPPPPPVPAFVSAAIENATPARLEMTYNLTLASIVPAASSFSVRVNSTARTVNSVSVSGTKVVLALASPVVYGNTITVAYTKPATSPLQTSAGGQAVTITAQPVSNNVSAVTPPPVVITPPPVVVSPPPATTPNTPPVVVVNYQLESYSGFEGVINATGSYDKDNDKLTFSWVVPANLPVSSTAGSIIKFLSPVVGEPEKAEFTLKVSDGKTTVSKTFQVSILPYYPELKAAEVIKVEASNFQTPYYPQNILDGDITTLWSAKGDTQWIILELKEPFNIQHVTLAFQPGQNKEAYFDVLGSENKEDWEPILIKSKSCAFSGNMQVFEFPPSKTGKEFRYVKLVGLGNAVDLWNFISEVRVYGYGERNLSDFEKQIVKIYPNPAASFTNISIEDQAFIPEFVKIITLSGTVLLYEKLDPDTRLFQIPFNFRQGIYVIQMGTGNITMFTQKLIVTD